MADRRWDSLYHRAKTWSAPKANLKPSYSVKKKPVASRYVSGLEPHADVDS